jgi:hypothetical protein
MSAPTDALDRSTAGIELGALVLHHEEKVELPVAQDVAFDFLDDHRNLSSHMNESSWMMAGAKMSIEFDAANGRAEGSLLRLRGTVLGVPLLVEERVIERRPPQRKVWQTVGDPRLWVIGGYRMGFDVAPQGELSVLRVFIDYRLPARGIGHWWPWLAGRYARWCVARMTGDARAHFSRMHS